MTEPIATSDDLATALNDPTINEDRAEFWIGQAQTLCETIIKPLPAEAAVVVIRVASRAYANSTNSVRGQQIAQSGSPMAGVAGGVWLSRADKSDLRRLGGGGNAFNIDMLPTGYALDLPWWDASA